MFIILIQPEASATIYCTHNKENDELYMQSIVEILHRSANVILIQVDTEMNHEESPRL